ncbi:Protein involved in plasmid maintenance/nuclear protein involved in lipid metabolism, partial [Pseudoloma neurophilia]
HEKNDQIIKNISHEKNISHNQYISHNHNISKICPMCHGYTYFSSDNIPFFSGFGNKLSDLIAYKSLGISRSKIFIISSDGQLSDEENSKSSYDMRPFIQKATKQHSYVTLNNFATTLFPSVRVESNNYSDFYFYGSIYQDKNGF